MPDDKDLRKKVDEISEAVQQILAQLKYQKELTQLDINNHQKECMNKLDKEFIKKTEFDKWVETYMINKQKKFITFSDFIKSIVQLAFIITVITALYRLEVKNGANTGTTESNKTMQLVK